MSYLKDVILHVYAVVVVESLRIDLADCSIDAGQAFEVGGYVRQESNEEASFSVLGMFSQHLFDAFRSCLHF